MSCFCFSDRHNNQNIFHWPNFTFSASQQSINPRRVHSTSSLKGRQKPKGIHKRRHTLANFWKHSHSRTSLQTTKTAPAAINEDMSDQYQPPPGPPPSYGRRTGNDDGQMSQPPANQQHVAWAQPGSRSSELASNNPYHNAHRNPSQGLPPSSSEKPPEYQAPPGPPPSWSEKKAEVVSNEEYAPPPGPPPKHETQEDAPPPYDPWLAVPDNALLPPPPTIQDDKSPTANASSADAAKGHAWTRQNPLWSPRRHDQQTLARIANGDVRLTMPPRIKNVQITYPSMGCSRVKTVKGCQDTILLSDVPLYTASTGSPKTVYFELRVISMTSPKDWRGRQSEECGIAIGLLAPPYPSWRLPGWHRGSIGIHGDDGRRYVDNTLGGHEFTSEFRKNDIVGIGMAYSPPLYAGQKNRCEVFFTRNGKKEGGWDLHEERDKDSEEGNVAGLEGDYDLLAAVGCFGAVEFEVRMQRQEWLFKPTS